MKKFGFTLAELLITLTIIGISAALVVPTVGNIMPDENKAKVLKYSVQLNNALATMFNDENLYQPSIISYNAEGEAIFDCEGVACFGNFAETLGRTIGLDDNTLETPDGSLWDIEENNNNTCTISIHTRPVKSNCSYSANCNTARDVDTFVFRIDNLGNVSAGDALTDAYLRNPLQTGNRKEAFATAQSYLDDGKNY